MQTLMIQNVKNIFKWILYLKKKLVTGNIQKHAKKSVKACACEHWVRQPWYK